MAKKVLILSSSPRRGGNSDTLCDEFMRGAAESNHEVEKIFPERQNNPLLYGMQYMQSVPEAMPSKKTTRQKSSKKWWMPM